MDRIDPRRLIGLLLALNLGVFLAGMAMQSWSPPSATPLVFNADKIRLLAVPAAYAPLPPAPETSPTPPPPASDAMADAANPRCLSWKSLDAAGLVAVEAHLKQLGIATKAYDFELANEAGKKLGWWVYLPPVANHAALQATIEEVRSLGVTDYAPVRGGAMRDALSLGAFANLAKAREHAAHLADKGIKGVRYAPRPEIGAVRLIISETLAASALPNLDADWPNGLQPIRCSQP